MKLDSDALRVALGECQRVLAMMIDPRGKGSGTAIISAYAQCVEAEAKARKALASLPSNPAEPSTPVAETVTANPLVWRDHGPNAFPARFWSAETPFGRYEIEEESASDTPRYRLEWHSRLIADEDSLPAAQETAQSDFARRLSAALSAPSVKQDAGWRGLVQWAHDTLYEINLSNYDHDEVCKLNDASVEVILGLAAALGERHGKTEMWWADYLATHEVPTPPQPGEGVR